jgi:GMP synthase-like glutamine amidotransferase
MPLKIHCFQHVPFEDLGHIKTWINKEGHQLHYTRFFEKYTIPKPGDYDWLIVMGGPMGANDEDKYPWLEEEKLAIRQAIEKQKTVLGICLGSQLIAAALGAKVFKNKEPEIGWFNVNLTNEGANNYLFKDFGKTFKVFQWHGDTFDLPKGAKQIASSDACLNQGFVIDNKVVGLQFHLEITVEGLEQMLEGAEDELIDAPFIQKKDDILKNSHYIISTNNKMIKILNRLKDGIL